MDSNQRASERPTRCTLRVLARCIPDQSVSYRQGRHRIAQANERDRAAEYPFYNKLMAWESRTEATGSPY